MLIGDANGADKAVQAFLSEQQYPSVEVFCSNGICRNNVGGWAVRPIRTSARTRNAQFYSAKDRAMAEEATIGLMIWDGKSAGTLMNVLRLVALGKKAVLHVAPENTAREFRSIGDWDEFIAGCDAGLKKEIADRAACEGLSEARAEPAQAKMFG